jgi:ubiquinone/menaquinone biosynthesis C-methylase UbiE
MWKGPKGTMNETPNTRMAELFNAMVGAYETWAEPLSARLAQVALSRTAVSAGDCVLDIGAGTGALSLQAAALGARVTAIDLSPAMVARLNQRLAPYPECKALVMDGEALTFEDGTFDAAFSVWTNISPSCKIVCGGRRRSRIYDFVFLRRYEDIMRYTVRRQL